MLQDAINYPYYFDKLKNSTHFKGLSEDTLQDILTMFHIETWNKGFQAFRGDKTFFKFYFIVSGRVKMYQYNLSSGNEYTLYIQSSGDIFDIISLLDGSKHDIQMEALDDVELLVAPIEIVRDWVYKHPNFNKTLLPLMAKQLREMEEKTTNLALLDTWTRTIKLFIEHTQVDKQDSALDLINDLSHSEIAKILGTSRNVVNRHLQQLKNEDILDIKRKNIEVKNIQKLLTKLN